MSFASLKKSSGSFSTLTKEIEKLNGSGKQADDRLWKPGVDKSGNGFAIIRFLPQATEGELPWAQVWSHAFQGTGGWLIENCPTTKGEKCPVCAHNSTLWSSGRESDKDVARKQKRKLSYYANIYVIKDPLNPENEGQVFLYKFGKRIFDKVSARMKEDANEYDPQPAINPFDLWTGADFKLKIKQVAGYWNYDDSAFSTPGVLGGFDDDRLEEIYEKIYSLSEYTDDSNFKSYEELNVRLQTVLGKSVRPTVDRETYEDEESGFGDYSGATSEQSEERSWTSDLETFSVAETATASSSDEDDALSYFARLAEED